MITMFLVIETIQMKNMCANYSFVTDDCDNFISYLKWGEMGFTGEG